MRIYCLQMLDEYWDEGDTHYSDDFDSLPEQLFQYYNELTLAEAIESAYLMWKVRTTHMDTQIGHSVLIVNPCKTLLCHYGGG